MKKPKRTEVRTGRYGIAHLAVFISGFAGLGYEIVWIRLFSLGLGHELPSMLAVVAAFFAGLSIGAWALDGVVSRTRYPGRDGMSRWRRQSGCGRSYRSRWSSGQMTS